MIVTASRRMRGGLNTILMKDSKECLNPERVKTELGLVWGRKLSRLFPGLIMRRRRQSLGYVAETHQMDLEQNVQQLLLLLVQIPWSSTEICFTEEYDPSKHTCEIYNIRASQGGPSPDNRPPPTAGYRAKERPWPCEAMGAYRGLQNFGGSLDINYKDTLGIFFPKNGTRPPNGRDPPPPHGDWPFEHQLYDIWKRH